MYNFTFKVKLIKPMRRSAFKRSKTRLKPRTAKLPKKPTITKLKKQLWAITREIIFKQHGNDCYTCPAKALVGSNRQCGHFISSSVCSASIRYDFSNLRPQCASCNIWKSGNWIAFETHLRADGIDTEELKKRNRDTIGLKYDSLFYINKIAEYSTLLAELQQ